MSARKLILIVFLTLFSVPALAESDNFSHIKTDTIEGIIVPQEEAKQFFFSSSEGFWAPTQEEVLTAEGKLADYLREQKLERSPELWKNLSNYKRQYVGITADGKKKIWINFCNYSGHSRRGQISVKIGSRRAL